MSARAEILLYVLTVCVRAMTGDQVARLLGITDRANVKRLVRGLVARGLVSQVTVWAKPVPEMREPLFASVLFNELTKGDVRDVLNAARRRWAGVSAVPMAVIIPTKRVSDSFGVRRFGQLTHPTQASHDLAVAQALLAILDQNFNPQNWHGEDCTDICPLQNTVPDAVILNAEGEAQTIIEVVGEHYKEAKIRRLSEECHARRLRVEYW